MGKKKGKAREESTHDLQLSSSDIKSGNVYTSPPFKFIVEGTAFYIHAALVSQHSRPLDRMINGDMSETQKGYAVLEEDDQGTFGRFAEWVNKGYYTSGEVIDRSLDESASEKSIEMNGECEKRMESPAEALQPDEVVVVEDEAPRAVFGWNVQEPSDFGVVTSSRTLKTKRKMKSASLLEEVSLTPRMQLKESFIQRKTVIRQENSSVPPPLPNQSPQQDYTDVFLSHAQLYVFAEKYDIKKLKTLALENLHAGLAIYTLYEQRTWDIVALLRYVYANTSETVDDVEDLRTLLTLYMGYEMDTLMQDDDFRDLMVTDGGPLLADFMRMVMKRI
ncbi:MAG: hypothetical protein LQ339_000631 [Xanthoria mediterranea]|nr:MAG: hypothetical protein LQ339_000631 [Xanthoria mediterranea]